MGSLPAFILPFVTGIFQKQITSQVESIVSNAENAFESLKQTAESAMGVKRQVNAEGVDHSMEDFVDAHKYTKPDWEEIRAETPRKEDQGVPFDFTATPKEWSKRNVEEVRTKVTTAAANVVPQAASAATTSASEVSRQFKTLREMPSPVSHETHPRKPRQKPVGNFKQSVSTGKALLRYSTQKEEKNKTNKQKKKKPRKYTGIRDFPEVTSILAGADVLCVSTIFDIGLFS